MSVLGQQLIDIVRDKALEQPDFVYQQIDGVCFYVRDKKPSCLIGQALWQVGMIDASLEDSPLNLNYETLGGLADYFGWNIDYHELKWLRKVQRYQDTNYRWGAAVQNADNELRLGD